MTEVVRPSEPERTSVSAAALSGPVTRDQVLANAEQWVAAKLQYCQSANGEPDSDTSCAPTCERTSNPEWDPYRSDCSGFISWAWELPSPGLVTDAFAPYETSASTTVACADLLPGDAANRDPNVGHIVLFEKWVTPGQEALFLEEPGCSATIPYAHEFDSLVTCSGTSIDIAYEGDTFTAIRYVHIEDAPDAGGSSSSANSSTGASTSGSTSAAGSSSGSSHVGTSTGSSGAAGTSGSSGGVAASTGGTSGDVIRSHEQGCSAGPGSSSSLGLGCLVLGLVARRRRRA